MTTSPARNPVTFLSGGRYSIGLPVSPPLLLLGWVLVLSGVPMGVLGWEGRYNMDYDSGSDSTNAAVVLFAGFLPLHLLAARPPVCAWPGCPALSCRL